MVEVGCATPELLSMSKHFRDLGWRCIGIEPNPRFVALHKACGNEVYEYAASDVEVESSDFTVVETDAAYTDQALSGHSYSSLGVKPEYLDYKNGSISHFKQTSIKVCVRRLDSILETHCSNVQTIDYLAIDVEGYELEVMKGFSVSRFKPKVIVLENLFHNPEYDAYMQSIGYKMHSRKKYNYVYCPI
jgi:FkbM family methyltransferase